MRIFLLHTGDGFFTRKMASATRKAPQVAPTWSSKTTVSMQYARQFLVRSEKQKKKKKQRCLSHPTRHLFSFWLFLSAPLRSCLLFRGVFFSVRNNRCFNARLHASRNRRLPGRRRPLRGPVMAVLVLVLVLVSMASRGCK